MILENSIEYKGFMIAVNYEDDSRYLRDFFNEECVLGKWLFTHRRYNLGHHPDWSKKEINEYIENYKDEIAFVFPVSMYQHSDVRVYIGSPTCPWDSGRIGVIVVSKKELGEFEEENQNREFIEKVLDGYMDEYTQYLNGEIYCYCISDENGECIESCGGYFSEEACLKDAQYIVDGYQKAKELEKRNLLKVLIKEKCPLWKRTEVLSSI